MPTLFGPSARKQNGKTIFYTNTLHSNCSLCVTECVDITDAVCHCFASEKLVVFTLSLPEVHFK